MRPTIRHETAQESHGINGERVRYEEEIRYLKERISFLETEFIEFRTREKKLLDILDRKLLPAPTTPDPPAMMQDSSVREDDGGKKGKRGKKGKKGKRGKKGKKRG